MALGNQLRIARKSKGLTLKDVQGDTGISVSFLSDIERGRTDPSLDTLRTLSAYYGVAIGELMNEKASGNPLGAYGTGCGNLSEQGQPVPPLSKGAMMSDPIDTIRKALEVLRGTRLMDLWYHNLDQDIREGPVDEALAYLDTLAAGQSGNLWVPVPDGDLVPTITDGEMWAYERDGKLGKAIVIHKDHFHGDIILADGYAVCTQRVAGVTP
jgi:DNA-binding XRE family transcriptional regulator